MSEQATREERLGLVDVEASERAGLVADVEAEAQGYGEGEVVKDPQAPLGDEEAQSALEAMLASTPQAAPQEQRRISRLGFSVTLTGVSERIIDMTGKRSERPPTKSERARGIFTNQRDLSKFNLLLVAAGLVDPDLTNPELLGKFGPRPEDVVRNWFLPGEIIQLADVVMDLSGYSDEAVEKAGK